MMMVFSLPFSRRVLGLMAWRGRMEDVLEKLLWNVCVCVPSVIYTV